MAERQSPDGTKRPRGTPTFLTPVRQKVPLHEVAHQGKQLQSQKPDGHAHTKNAITLCACTTSSGEKSGSQSKDKRGGGIGNGEVMPVATIQL